MLGFIFVHVWVCVCRTITGTQDVVLLENMTEHYPVIMIRIKECFGQFIKHGFLHHYYNP